MKALLYYRFKTEKIHYISWIITIFLIFVLEDVFYYNFFILPLLIGNYFLKDKSTKIEGINGLSAWYKREKCLPLKQRDYLNEHFIRVLFHVLLIIITAFVSVKILEKDFSGIAFKITLRIALVILGIEEFIFFYKLENFNCKIFYIFMGIIYTILGFLDYPSDLDIKIIVLISMLIYTSSFLYLRQERFD